jgi:FkbM family methyltransferase
MSAFAKLLGPNDVVYDIGANLGWHTAMISSRILPNGEVHAFEPQPGLQRLLAATAAQLPNAHLYPVALSSENGIVELHIPDDHTMTGLRNWIGAYSDMNVQVQSCEARRLDDLVSEGLPAPDLIIIDVEGAELLVFQGARRTLDRTDAPVIFFEAAARFAGAFDQKKFDARDFLASLPAPRWNFVYLDESDGAWHSEPLSGEFATVAAIPAARAADHPCLVAG